MSNIIRRSAKLLSVALTAGMLTAVAAPQSFADDRWVNPDPAGEGPAGAPWKTETLGPRPDGRGDAHRHSYYRDYDRHRFDHRYRYRHRRHNGNSAAIVGGIVGLAAGLALSNRSRAYTRAYEPWSPEWYRYCDRKYRSFNPRTGYFLGYDGQYHFCRYR